MRVEVAAFNQLSPEMLSLWGAFQDAAAAPLDSPYYRPEFARLIDDALNSVEVAIVEQAGEVAAFFPFHRLPGGIGKPVGLFLNDFQGPILRQGATCCLRQTLRACRLRAWDFDHLPVALAGGASHGILVDASPFIDLSEGFEAYEQMLLRQSRDYGSQLRRVRKMQREIGPFRLEIGTQEPVVLETLIRWKRQQFARTGVPDRLGDAWVRQTLERWATFDGPRFQGLVNALYAGDRLVGIEMGLRSGAVYHGVWCAYDQLLRSYAPGRITFFELHRRLVEQGVRRVECGKGENEYKSRTKTGEHLVASGSVACGAMQRVVRGAWWTMRRWARSSPIRSQLKAAANMYFRLRSANPKPAKEVA